jgi:hypothetical protein
MIKRLIGAGTLGLIVLATSACDNRSVIYPTTKAAHPPPPHAAGGGPASGGAPAKGDKTKDQDKSKKADTDEPPRKGDDSKKD